MKLTNREIHRAFPALVRLGQVKLPVKTSLEVAVLANKLESAFKVIAGEDEKLIKHYGEKDEKGQIGIKAASPKMLNYVKDLDVVMEKEWDADFDIKKVKLPEKITGTCDGCKKNLDVTFIIEPAILMPLAEKFIEIV